jgi:hypothetical protein
LWSILGNNGLTYFFHPVDENIKKSTEETEDLPYKKVITKKSTKSKKKKFPWLLVVGGAVVVVALILLLSKKSSGNGGTNQSNTYYLNVAKFPENQVTGTPGSGNHPYPQGEIVSFNYTSTQSNEFIYAILDNTHVGRSGTIVMNMNHELKALSVNNILHVDSSRVLGRINYDGDQDWFVFQVGSSGTYTIYTEYYPSDRIDSWIYLYNVDNPSDPITDNDDDPYNPSTLCSRIITTLNSGFYLVMVREFSNDSTGGFYVRVRSGSYTLSQGSINDKVLRQSKLKIKQ